jgi:hypothetical protein
MKTIYITPMGVKRPEDEADLLPPNSAGGLPLCHLYAFMVYCLGTGRSKPSHYEPTTQIHKLDINAAFHYQSITRRSSCQPRHITRWEG